jgi:hypothetical protein
VVGIPVGLALSAFVVIEEHRRDYAEVLLHVTRTSTGRAGRLRATTS